MRVPGVAIAAAATGILWVGVSAQQEMLPKPGPGSGVTRVIGEVNIANMPNVHVTEMPPITIASPISIANPPFVRKGARYLITWNDGGSERVTVLDAGHDGWVQVEGRRVRWINLQVARSVEDDR